MAISLQHISISFGNTQALRDINLAVNAGEQVALIGPSGCGKTTLLRLMGTQLTPQEGKVRLLNTDLNSISPKELKKLRSDIALIPQHLGLVPNVSVLRNVLNGGLSKINLLQTLRQIIYPNPCEIKHVFNLLERTDIGEKLYERTDSLSGGQQQRVALARALYQNPALLLADEPISAIDPARGRFMIDSLTQLSREEGLTLIVSLHNLELAKEFFPRLIGLRRGKIAFDCSPDQFNSLDCDSLYQLDSPHSIKTSAPEETSTSPAR